MCACVCVISKLSPSSTHYSMTFEPLLRENLQLGIEATESYLGTAIIIFTAPTYIPLGISLFLSCLSQNQQPKIREYLLTPTQLMVSLGPQTQQLPHLVLSKIQVHMRCVVWTASHHRRPSMKTSRECTSIVVCS